MILGAAVSHRLGGIFGYEIEQIVAVNIMFTQRRRVGDVGLNVFDSFAQRRRQPALQMVNVPNDHNNL